MVSRLPLLPAAYVPRVSRQQVLMFLHTLACSSRCSTPLQFHRGVFDKEFPSMYLSSENRKKKFTPKLPNIYLLIHRHQVAFPDLLGLTYNTVLYLYTQSLCFSLFPLFWRRSYCTQGDGSFPVQRLSLPCPEGELAARRVTCSSTCFPLFPLYFVWRWFCPRCCVLPVPRAHLTCAIGSFKRC